MAIICDKCKKEITDLAYCEVGAVIVRQDTATMEPIIFKNPQERSYYAKKMIVHDRCFIQFLIDYKVLDIPHP